MNSKKIHFILLFCLVVPWAATFSYLHYAKRTVRKEVKHRMLAQIDKNELVHLTFAVADVDSLLKWEHAKEFEFKGEMYDVVQLEKKGDSIAYWCWHDAEESRLNKKLDGLLANLIDSNPFEHNKNKTTQEFFKKLFFNQRSEKATAYSTYAGLIYIYNTSVLTATFVPPVPPPRMV